jgi:hypothetical protein
MLNTTKGLLVEYALSILPLVLVFEFNPKTLSRTRTIKLKVGNAPGNGNASSRPGSYGPAREFFH